MKSVLKSLFFFTLGAGLSTGILLPRILSTSESAVVPAVSETPGEDPVRTVEGKAAEWGRLRPFVELTGEVVAESNVEVLPEVGGKIVALGVRVGDHVVAGQTVIAQIDPSRPGTPYSISQVMSPLTGVITGLTAQVGASATPQNSLGTVGTLGHPRVELLVPETAMSGLGIGQAAEVRFASQPNLAVKAVVDRLSPVVDQVSRTKKVTLRLVNPTDTVVPGLFAQAKVLKEPLSPKVLIEQKALLSSGGVSLVYVSDQGTAHRRVVEPGQAAGGLIEIRSGLQAGEVVVTAGQEMLEEGTKILVRQTEGGKR